MRRTQIVRRAEAEPSSTMMLSHFSRGNPVDFSDKVDSMVYYTNQYFQLMFMLFPHLGFCISHLWHAKTDVLNVPQTRGEFWGNSGEFWGNPDEKLFVHFQSFSQV